MWSPWSKCGCPVSLRQGTSEVGTQQRTFDISNSSNTEIDAIKLAVVWVFTYGDRRSHAFFGLPLFEPTAILL